MTVIGNNLPEEVRKVQWIDLLESKRSVKRFKNSKVEQERDIAACDEAFFVRTLQKYAS